MAMRAMSRLRITVINSKQSSLPDRRSASYMHAESRRPDGGA
jgi:hypothetical protein